MWQYALTIPASLFTALIAVWVSHRLSRKYEYHKAIKSVKHEVTVNIATCDLDCMMIDDDLNAPKDKWRDTPYKGLHEAAWNTWKGVILVRNSELAARIEEAYFAIPIANTLLYRIEELKWGAPALVTDLKETPKGHLESARRYISKTLEPRLKDAKEFLDKES